MIKVNVRSDLEGAVRRIHISGHAGYADSGQDIICAAVSALALNYYNSLEALTNDHFEGSVDPDGVFCLEFPDKISQQSKLLTESLILGLSNIQDSYGEQYIKIRFEEV